MFGQSPPSSLLTLWPYFLLNLHSDIFFKFRSLSLSTVSFNRLHLSPLDRLNPTSSIINLWKWRNLRYYLKQILGLLNEFPSLIICLCCGLTPINPVVLQCQHMFCQQCLNENMEEELICPACQEFSINLEVHVNKKY